jgi:hypothetical protein
MQDELSGRLRGSPAGAQHSSAVAYQEGERAKKMEKPTTRGPIESAAQRYAALAAKFEAARK